MRTPRLRLLSALLSVAMLFTFLPTAAFAADTSSPVQLDANDSANGIKYTLNSNGTAAVSGFTSSCPEAVVIPSSITDTTGTTTYTVTKISSAPRSNKAQKIITSVRLPSTITDIGNTAFMNCTKLASVTFDTSSQLSSISPYAFSGCTSLTSIEIPSGVTQIHQGAFEDCSALSTITIPASMIRINFDAFAGCTSLAEVKYDGDKWDDINSDTDHLTPDIVKQRRTITFTTNTTTPDKIDDQSVYDGYLVTEPTDPTKEHYTFDGWYKDGDSKDSKYDFSTPVSGNLHLYANWIPETYVIKFDVNGHGLDTAPGDIKDVAYSSTFKKPADPTETGYTFIGWYTDKDCTDGNKFDFDAPVTSDTYEITLYAKWEINKYTVTFDFNTGKTSTPKTEEVEYGTPVSKPTEPTNTGYTFGGWYTDKACTDGEEFTFDADGKSTTSITDNIILYAKWTKNRYTVTFDVDGQTDLLPSVPVEHGNGVSKPTNPTKEGYTFDGWYTDANHTNKYALWGDSITRNTTLYARWNVNQYELTIHDTDTDATTKSYDYGTTIKLDIPQRDGYTFDGWTAEGIDVPQLNQNLQYEFTMPAGNVTLTAKWLKDAYTVTFNGMEHELDIVRTNVKRNTPVAKPADPVDKGYTFHGWYTDKDCTAAFDFDTPITADTTLYAKWTKNAEPVKPSEPDKPGTPDKPSEPDKPNKPDNPSEPDKPSNPDKPSKPETKTYSVLVFDGEAELDGETVTKAEAGKTITVRLMADIVPAGQTFDHWDVLPETLELKDAQSTETTFVMPEEAVTLRAVYRDISSAPQSVNPASAALGAAVVGTGVVIAGWTAYNIGLELYAKWVLPAGAEMPNTRGELAVLLWQIAGSPEPAPLTEGMSELEKAERWVVDNGLMAESKNSSFAPEEKVSKLEVFLTLKKAKALKQ